MGFAGWKLWGLLSRKISEAGQPEISQSWWQGRVLADRCWRETARCQETRRRRPTALLFGAGPGERHPNVAAATRESWVCRRTFYRLHAPRVDKLVGAGRSSEKQWQAGTCVLPPGGTKACRDSSLRCLVPAVMEGNRSWQWHPGDALPGSGMGLFCSPQHHVTPEKHFWRGWALQDAYFSTGESQRLPMLKFGLVFFLLEIVSKFSSKLIAQNLWKLSITPVQIKGNLIT